MPPTRAATSGRSGVCSSRCSRAGGRSRGMRVSDTLASVLKIDPEWHALPATVPPSVRALVEGCLKKDPQRPHRRYLDGALRPRSAALAMSSPPVATRQAPAAACGGRVLLVLAGAAVGAAAFAATTRRTPPPPAPVARFALTLPPGRQLVVPRQAIAISPTAHGSRTRRATGSISDRCHRSKQPRSRAPRARSTPCSRLTVRSWPSGPIRPSSGLPSAAACRSRSRAAAGAERRMGGRAWYHVRPGGSGIVRVSPEDGTLTTLIPVVNAVGRPTVRRCCPTAAPCSTRCSTKGLSTTTAGKARASSPIRSTVASGRRSIEGGSDPGMCRPDTSSMRSGGRSSPSRSISRRSAAPAVACPSSKASRRRPPRWVGRHSLRSRTPARWSTCQDRYPSRRWSPSTTVRASARHCRCRPVRIDTRAYPRTARRSPSTRATARSRSSPPTTCQVRCSGANHLREQQPLPDLVRRRQARGVSIGPGGGSAVFWQAIGSGSAERLTTAEPGTSHVPESWSRDGVLLYSVRKGAAVFRSGRCLIADRQPKAVWRRGLARGLPTNAEFSPDGKWVAYQTADSWSRPRGGPTWQPFPATGPTHEIGRGGRPVWSRDGKELFFVPAPAQFRMVKVTMTPGFYVHTARGGAATVRHFRARDTADVRFPAGRADHRGRSRRAGSGRGGATGGARLV